jgi:hypothetical protein
MTTHRGMEAPRTYQRVLCASVPRCDVIIKNAWKVTATLAATVAFCAAVTGQNRAGSIAGRIITPDGAAAPDVDVFAAPRDQPGTPVAKTRSAWDGRYELTGLPAGEFFVGASTDSALVALYPGVGERDRATLVRLFDDVPAEGIDIWLLPAPRRFNLAGRVTDAEGRGVRNVDIEYGSPGGPQAGLWSVHQPDGFFLIEGVPSGTLVLLGRAETAAGPLMGLASTDVTGSIEDVRLRLGPAGRVEGRIAPESGALPPGVRPRVVLVQTLLTSSALYPDEAATASADGSFRIDKVVGHFRIDVRDLPDGWTVTRILHDGRPLADRRLTVPVGARIGALEIRVAK